MADKVEKLGGNVEFQYNTCFGSINQDLSNWNVSSDFNTTLVSVQWNLEQIEYLSPMDFNTTLVSVQFQELAERFLKEGFQYNTCFGSMQK